MSMNSEVQREFMELLPFYLNGTLGSVEKTWFEQMLQVHPECLVYLRDEQVVAANLRAAVGEISPAVSTEEALTRARVRWRQALSPTNIEAVPLWRCWVRIPVLTFAGISAAALIEFGYIALSLTGASLAPTRSALPDCRLEPRVQLTLAPSGSWEDVLLLLRRHGLVLRAGPNENGQIWLAVPEGQTSEQVLTSVQASHLVQMAEMAAPKKSPECQP